MRNSEGGRNGRLGHVTECFLCGHALALNRRISLPGFHSHYLMSLTFGSVPVGFLHVSRCCHLLAGLGQERNGFPLEPSRGRSHRNSVSILACVAYGDLSWVLFYVVRRRALAQSRALAHIPAG
jgi:hypothetical protein